MTNNFIMFVYLHNHRLSFDRSLSILLREQVPRQERHCKVWTAGLRKFTI